MESIASQEPRLTEMPIPSPIPLDDCGVYHYNNSSEERRIIRGPLFVEKSLKVSASIAQKFLEDELKNNGAFPTPIIPITGGLVPTLYLIDNLITSAKKGSEIWNKESIEQLIKSMAIAINTGSYPNVEYSISHEGDIPNGFILDDVADGLNSMKAISELLKQNYSNGKLRMITPLAKVPAIAKAKGYDLEVYASSIIPDIEYNGRTRTPWITAGAGMDSSLVERQLKWLNMRDYAKAQLLVGERLSSRLVFDLGNIILTHESDWLGSTDYLHDEAERYALLDMKNQLSIRGRYPTIGDDLAILEFMRMTSPEQFKIIYPRKSVSVLMSMVDQAFEK